VRRIQLSIVIPAHNEEVTVAGVVRGHREVARVLASSFELIVCDDGSTDGTWAELQRSCAEVAELRLLRNPSRLGIPPTMKRLYAEAQGEWIYFAPADGQVPAAALETIWRARDGAALVVGRRIPRRDPAARVLIAELYSAGLQLIFRLPVGEVDGVGLYRGPAQRACRVGATSSRPRCSLRAGARTRSAISAPQAARSPSRPPSSTLVRRFL